jgi:hypothetical protein
MAINKKLLEEIVTALNYYIKTPGEVQLWLPTSARSTSDVLNDLKASMAEK